MQYAAARRASAAQIVQDDASITLCSNSVQYVHAKEQTCLSATQQQGLGCKLRSCPLMLCRAMIVLFTLCRLLPSSQQTINNVCHSFTRKTEAGQITVRQKSCQPTPILEQAKLIYMLTQLVRRPIQTQSPARQENIHTFEYTILLALTGKIKHTMLRISELVKAITSGC